MELAAPATVNADPLLCAALVMTALITSLAVRTAASASRRHWVTLSVAVLLLAIAWISPLATVAQHYLLSAHLLQISLVMGAVPPLLLLALPRDVKVQLPRPVPLLLRVVTHPLVAIGAVNAAFFGWHTTGAYTASMQSSWLYALQQTSLLLVSLAFWWPIITPLPPPARVMGPLPKMGYILLATIPQTFGGLVVALSHHVLYPLYARVERVFGIDVMTDQQIAGASIALVSKIALFTAFIVIFMRALDTGVPEVDDGGGGDGGIGPVIAPRPLPSGTPRWLLDIARNKTVPEPGPRRRVRIPAGSGPRRD